MQTTLGSPALQDSLRSLTYTRHTILKQAPTDYRVQTTCNSLKTNAGPFKDLLYRPLQPPASPCNFQPLRLSVNNGLGSWPWAFQSLLAHRVRHIYWESEGWMISLLAVFYWEAKWELSQETSVHTKILKLGTDSMEEEFSAMSGKRNVLWQLKKQWLIKSQTTREQWLVRGAWVLSPKYHCLINSRAESSERVGVATWPVDFKRYPWPLLPWWPRPQDKCINTAWC